MLAEMRERVRRCWVIAEGGPREPRELAESCLKGVDSGGIADLSRASLLQRIAALSCALLDALEVKP